jgi:hypothetical protein
MREPFLRSVQHERRKKIGPIARLIEAMLDFALIVGFLSPVGLLISIAARGVF